MKKLLFLILFALCLFAWAQTPVVNVLTVTFDWAGNAPYCGTSTATLSCVTGFEVHKPITSPPNPAVDPLLGTIIPQLNADGSIKQVGITGTVNHDPGFGQRKYYVITCGRDDTGAKVCSAPSNVAMQVATPRPPTNLAGQFE